MACCDQDSLSRCELGNAEAVLVRCSIAIVRRHTGPAQAMAAARIATASKMEQKTWPSCPISRGERISRADGSGEIFLPAVAPGLVNECSDSRGMRAPANGDKLDRTKYFRIR